MINESLRTVLSFLKKNNIFINVEEFRLQVEGHPDFPSLLSISDALTFFNIENKAFTISKEDHSLLPESFIALVDQDLKIVETTDNIIFVTDKKTIEDFNVVLLIETDTDTDDIPRKSHKQNRLSLEVLIILCITLFFLYSVWIHPQYIFLCASVFCLSLFSLVLAFNAFKKNKELSSLIPDSFCKNNIIKTDCESVMGSKKWKIFNIVDLSAISIAFFLAEIMCISIFTFFDAFIPFSGILKNVLLICFLPISFLSLFYQAVVVKKWCSICLLIIFTTYFQLFLLFRFGDNPPFESRYLLNTIFIFAFCTFSIFLYSNIISKSNELLTHQKKFFRFRRNVSFFKNNLLAEKKIQDNNLDYGFKIGKSDQDSTLVFVTSPYCDFCKKLQPSITRIAKNTEYNFNSYIYFDVDIKAVPENMKIIYRTLTAIYLYQGADKFLEALDSWHTTHQHGNNDKKWLSAYHFNFETENTDRFLQNQKKWCMNNEIIFFPEIFIDGNQYPREYDRDDLEFFLAEIYT